MGFKVGQKKNIFEVEIGLDSPFFVVAGPCVIEEENTCLDISVRLAEVSRSTGVPIIFKASYDKANRSSIDSYRGPGLYQGLNILKRVQDHTGLPLLTDVHSPRQAEDAARFVDILQVPAFLCRQTDLVLACARTGLPVNVKKGQFISPMEMDMVVKKIQSQGNDKILLTERGTFFGYHKLVSDMLSIRRMQFLGCPVVFDATHSIQTPGLQMCSSDAYKANALTLAKAAVAAGANGLFLEVHPNPKESKCDKSTVLPLAWVEDLLRTCKKIWEIVQ